MQLPFFFFNLISIQHFKTFLCCKAGSLAIAGVGNVSRGDRIFIYRKKIGPYIWKAPHKKKGQSVFDLHTQDTSGGCKWPRGFRQEEHDCFKAKF